MFTWFSIIINRNAMQYLEIATRSSSHHAAWKYTAVAFRITTITAKAWLLDALHSTLD